MKVWRVIFPANAYASAKCMEEEYLGRLFTEVYSYKFTNICPLFNTSKKYILTHLVLGFLVDYINV